MTGSGAAWLTSEQVQSCTKIPHLSEQKHFILLNNLIPTSTLEGEPLLGELCNTVRFGGLGTGK